MNKIKQFVVGAACAFPFRRIGGATRLLSMTAFAVFCAAADGVAAATLDAALIRTSGSPAVADGKFYGYRTVAEGPGDKAFKDALALAKAEHAPLVAIWSNEDCHYCDSFVEDLNDNARAVSAWLSTNGAVCVYFKDKSGDDAPTKGHMPAACYDAYNFVYTTCGSSPVWPLVGFYCEKWDGTVVKWSHGNVGIKTFAWLKRNFGSWCAKNGIGEESGVSFVVGTTPADRLEAVPGVTTNVVVPIRRRVAKNAEMFTLRAAFAGGQAVELPVEFETGALVPTQDAVVSLEGTHAVGETVTLTLLDDDLVLATSAIAFVKEPENSPKNPMWIGERGATTLAAGEWTMDRGLALAKARTAGGSTLTLIGGSLWCPDCVNADAYLVDTKMFRNWAATNAIYCTAADVPKFPQNGTTCLLAYDATEVSDRYVNATEPPQERIQSGAGYLSRKMIPQTGNSGTNAAAVLARNLNLATNVVANGGLCRPECLDDANPETGRWKTGVPCFVMQNAEGRITGRLFQFSNVSPTNAASAAAYVQRLEELRQLADDPTEERNRHWSTATDKACELALGGEVRSTISAIDTSDFWRITGRERWSMGRFEIRGTGTGIGETNVRLVLWKRTGDVAKQIASAAGNIASGITLADQEILADEDIDYFIQVEAIDTSAAFVLEHEGNSVVAYTLTATAEENPGAIMFAKTSATVSEADAKQAGGTYHVYVPTVRISGASGETNVVLTLDEDLTTAFPDRYRIAVGELSWADGDFATKNFVVYVFDDANADGTQTAVFRCGDNVFTLTIVDNDKANVGKLALDGVNPAAAKKGVVIAEEDSYVMVGVSRNGGASGGVGCTLKATAGEFTDEPTLAWRSREAGEKTAILKMPKLADCKQGKAVVSFESLSGITADSSARTLTVQLVATNAPRFEVSEKNLSLVRYCACSQEVAVVNLDAGATAKVAKLSGSVPSGLTVKLVGSRLVIAGVPSRACACEAVYQVSQTLNRKTTAGLTVRLVFAVTDVSAMEPTAPGANPSVAKSRTFGDQPIVDALANRLTGILSSLTIPPTGRCSARYKCKAGTVSLSSANWSDYDRATGDLTATLVVARKPYALEVLARADGSVSITLTDPDFAESELSAEVVEGWSAANPATDWIGYYTAAIDSPADESVSGALLAAGNPILTMKMQSASVAKKGLMSYAGVLPNGQAFSGSGTLVRDVLDKAILPVYYRTAKEFFTLAPQIKANAPAKAIGCGAEILPWWTHTETVTNGSFEVGYLRIVGSYYDAALDLTTTVSPTATGHEMTASGTIEPIPVTIESKRVTLDRDAAKAAGASLSFNRTTGMVSGSFRTTNASGKVTTALYKGVILPDWGDGCPSCGDIPWASGAFWHADTISYEVKGKARSLSVKRGDIFYIESN